MCQVITRLAQTVLTTITSQQVEVVTLILAVRDTEQKTTLAELTITEAEEQSTEEVKVGNTITTLEGTRHTFPKDTRLK